MYAASTAHDAPGWPDRLLLAMPGVTALAVVYWVLRYCGHGLDFTDESYYLVWAATPFEYTASVSQFGFVLHPLYALLGGDIVAFRQAGVIATLGLAWVLVWLVLGRSPLPPALSPAWRWALALPLACASLLITLLSVHWLPTPGYNSLAFQALLVAMSGLLLLERAPRGSGVLGPVLFGLGGWLAFMAKPSTAAALAVAALAWLALAGRLSRRTLALAAVSAALALVASAMAIDGSLVGFLRRLQSGLALAQVMSGKSAAQDMWRLGDFDLRPAGLALTLAVAGVMLVIYRLADAETLERRRTALRLSGALTLITLATLLGHMPGLSEEAHGIGLVFLGLPASLLLAAILGATLRGLRATRLADLALAALFLVLPHVFAFGTNRNYWENAASAALFWLLAALVVFGVWYGRRRMANVLAVAATGVLLVTAALLNAGLESPERQPETLRRCTTPLALAGSPRPLLHCSGYAAYLEEALRAARSAGLAPGTPMVDLTGQSPGLLYAIGARSLGLPWLLGDYPGSDAFAVAALGRVRCADLAAAWVLTEPGGPRSLSPAVLSSFGADLGRDYAPAAVLHPAPGAGGYDSRPPQSLLRPLRDPQAAARACEALR